MPFRGLNFPEGENLWDRTGTTIEPHTANDNLDLGTGTLGAGAITGTSLTDGTATLDDGSLTGGINATFSGAGTFGQLDVTSDSTPQVKFGYDASNYLDWTISSKGRHTLDFTSNGSISQYGMMIEKNSPTVSVPANGIDALAIKSNIPDSYIAGRALWVHAERNNAENLAASYGTFGFNAAAYAKGAGDLAGAVTAGRYIARVSGAGTVGWARGAAFRVETISGDNDTAITNAACVYVEGVLADAKSMLNEGTVDNAYGIYIHDNTEQAYEQIPPGEGSHYGVITTGYGLYLENISGAATNYAIYSAGGQSVHAGDLRIGGTDDPTVALDVTGDGLFSGTLTIGSTTMTEQNLIDLLALI